MLPAKELAVKILSPLLPLLMREHLCYLIQELRKRQQSIIILVGLP